MHSINSCCKTPEAHANSIGKTLEDHANFMKSTYVTGSDAVHPLDTYFTKAAELADPAHPEKGTTRNIIFNIH